MGLTFCPLSSLPNALIERIAGRSEKNTFILLAFRMHFKENALYKNKYKYWVESWAPNTTLLALITILGEFLCRRKPEHPEETYADGGSRPLHHIKLPTSTGNRTGDLRGGRHTMFHCATPPAQRIPNKTHRTQAALPLQTKPGLALPLRVCLYY